MTEKEDVWAEYNQLATAEAIAILNIHTILNRLENIRSEKKQAFDAAMVKLGYTIRRL